eukprot:jgi/Picre1/31478/NNA_006830.t1
MCKLYYYTAALGNGCSYNVPATALTVIAGADASFPWDEGATFKDVCESISNENLRRKSITEIDLDR